MNEYACRVRAECGAEVGETSSRWGAASVSKVPEAGPLTAHGARGQAASGKVTPGRDASNQRMGISPNNPFDRTAGSQSLAAAGQCER